MSRADIEERVQLLEEINELQAESLTLARGSLDDAKRTYEALIKTRDLLVERLRFIADAANVALAAHEGA